MDRRGFLKRMSAAAAVFTAAVSGRVAAAAGVDSVPAAAGPSTLRSSVDKAKPIAAAARKATPQVAITADTSRFEKAVGDAGRQVVELLRECRVTSSGWIRKSGDLERYHVTFMHRPDGAPLSELDHEAWRVIEKGYLTEIWMTAESDMIDVTHLGAPLKTEVCQPARTVHAEFISCRA